MKQKILISLLLIILLPLVTATFPDEWGEFQDDYTNRGFVADQKGYYETTAKLLSISQGNLYQALLIDADGDDNIEAIGGHGNYVMVWEITNEQIIEQASLSMGAAQNAQHTALPYNFDGKNDSLTKWVTIHGTNTSVFSYNGTLTLECSNTTSTPYSGIRCKNITGTTICYWAVADGNITEFNPATCGISTYNISSNDLFNLTFISTPYAFNYAPIIEDLQNNGKQIMVFACRSGSAHGLCAVNQQSMSLEWTNYFSGASGTNTLSIGGFLVYPMNADLTLYDDCIQTCKNSYPLVNVPIIGLLYKIPYATCINACGVIYGSGTYGGSNKIVATYAASGGANEFVQDGWMRIINNDGSTSSSNMVFDDIGTSGVAVAGNLVVLDYNGSFNTPVCTIIRTSATDNRIYCINYAGTKVFESGNVASTSLIQPASTIPSKALVAARFLENSTYYQMIKGNQIIELSGTSTVTIHNLESSIYGASTSLADIDNDLSLDICTQTTNQFECFSSIIINEPPNIHNNRSYGGYGHNLNIGSPVCVNSSVTFTAQECGGAATCNYDNDLEEDSERIVTNCGYDTQHYPYTSSFTTFLVNGDYALSNPSFSCYYNVTGNYYVRLYLQDQANTDVYSAYNTQAFSIQVIDGTPGIDCNIATSTTLPGTSTVVSTTTSEDEDFTTKLDSAFEDIGISGSKAKSFLWLLIMIGVAIMLAKATNMSSSTPYIIAIVEVMLLVLGWVLGMIGMVVIVTLSLLLATLLVMMFVFNRGSNGG